MIVSRVRFKVQKSEKKIHSIGGLNIWCFSVPSRAPLNVQVSNVQLGELKVQWDPLPQEHANGRLLGYKVYYRDYRYYSSVTTKTVNSPDVNKLILEGLKLKQTYKIAVAAFTPKGTGPKSYWTTSTTGIDFNISF